LSDDSGDPRPKECRQIVVGAGAAATLLAARYVPVERVPPPPVTPIRLAVSGEYLGDPKPQA
jgi:hypothetical protein